MTPSESAELIAALHGAYPNTYFDEAVAATFANSFILNDFEFAEAAVLHWTRTMDRFPTIAELNREIRRLKRRDEPEALPEPVSTTDLTGARAAFEDGYRRARHRLGDDPEVIERKIESRRRRLETTEAS